MKAADLRLVPPSRDSAARKCAWSWRSKATMAASAAVPERQRDLLCKLKQWRHRPKRSEGRNKKNFFLQAKSRLSSALRRKRDSNPRYIAVQQFSRLPPSTTRPFLQGWGLRVQSYGKFGTLQAVENFLENFYKETLFLIRALCKFVDWLD